MDWDDLKLVHTIADAGGLGPAAKRLGVNHSTVFRRLKAAEERLGVRLFDRLPEGYRPTDEGEELVKAASSVRDVVDGLERKLAGRDSLLTGTLRVTLPDSFGVGLLGPDLADFMRENPGIQLETIIDNGFFNLTRREADVAIRPTVAPPDNLVGRRVGRIAFAAYGHGGRQGPPEDWTWLGQDDLMAHLGTARWLSVHLPDVTVAMRSNSYAVLADAAEAGAGVAWLPCFVGDQRAGLTRLIAPEPELETDLWLLTHADLKGAARVRAFMGFMADCFKRKAALLGGEEPRDA